MRRSFSLVVAMHQVLSTGITIGFLPPYNAACRTIEHQICINAEVDIPVARCGSRSHLERVRCFHCARCAASRHILPHVGTFGDRSPPQRTILSQRVRRAASGRILPPGLITCPTQHLRLRPVLPPYGPILPSSFDPPPSVSLRSPRFAAMPSLHHDIVLNIIAVVRDKRDLSSLSLTSSQALQPARAALFHELTITIPTVTPPDSRVWQWADRIVLRLAFFESKSAFARLVRHVHVKEQCQGTKWGHEWTRRIAHALPLVNTVIIDDHYLDALDVAEGLLAVRPCDLDVKTNIDSFVRRDWTKLGARLCRAVLKDPLQVLIPPISPCFERMYAAIQSLIWSLTSNYLQCCVPWSISRSSHLMGPSSTYTSSIWADYSRRRSGRRLCPSSLDSAPRRRSGKPTRTASTLGARRISRK
jgi:hypothetical protein